MALENMFLEKHQDAQGHERYYALNVPTETGISAAYLREADEMLMGCTIDDPSKPPLLEMCFANGTAHYRMHTFNAADDCFECTLESWTPFYG